MGLKDTYFLLLVKGFKDSCSGHSVSCAMGKLHPALLRGKPTGSKTKRLSAGSIATFVLLALCVAVWKEQSTLTTLSASKPKSKSDTVDIKVAPLNPTTTARSTKSSQTVRRQEKQGKRESIVIVVPGHGHAIRLPQLKQTLLALKSSTETVTAQAPLDFTCIVYVWNDSVLESTTKELDFCVVEFNKGLWTHHMIKVGQSKLSRSAVESSTHVALLLDDMDAQYVNLPALLRTMQVAQLDVAGPSIPAWNTPSCLSRMHCRAHQTGHVDVLFTIYTKEKWTCWQQHLNLTINENGWGYDITMGDLCNASIGIVDHEAAYHNPVCEDADQSKCVERTYNGNAAWDQMFDWIKASMNFTTMEEARPYYYGVSLYKTGDMPYCKFLQFARRRLDEASLVPSRRLSRSIEWDPVLRELSGTEYLVSEKVSSVSSGSTSPHQNHSGSIALVDSIDDWFASNKGTVIAEPWVGFAHLPLRTHLPRHFANSEPSLDVALESDGLRQSPSVALFVFTRSMAAALSEKVRQMGLDNVKVCAVPRPIAGIFGPLYDPAADRTAATSSKASIVLWGSPYSRAAALHQLTTSRSKIWLFHNADAQKSNAIAAELQAEGVTPDSTVQLKIFNDRSNELNLLIRRNIVLVDVWPTGTVPWPLLAAMALQLPILIRKMEETEEYLGEMYPLFFASTSDLQTLLNDEAILSSKMLEAHLYLKGRMDTVVSYSTEAMARQMLDCTLEAMARWKKPEL
jgi:hypothetical protein